LTGTTWIRTSGRPLPATVRKRGGTQVEYINGRAGTGEHPAPLFYRQPVGVELRATKLNRGLTVLL